METFDFILIARIETGAIKKSKKKKFKFLFFFSFQFLYVNQTFAPSPDQILKNLYECYGNQNKLTLHYSISQAWGWRSSHPIATRVIYV